MKILLVEDNESIILGLEYLLQQEGYRIQTARNMHEAEIFVKDMIPDLILLDVALPDGNGFDFCAEVKQKWDYPVIFLTAKEDETDRIFSAMLSYPDKLFTREEILAAIWDISGNFVNDNTLSVTMKRLREKLADTEGEIIKTVRGIGYRIEKEQMER